MRVKELLEQKAGKPVISFEFSRAKTEKAAANLEKALDKLAEAKPDYVSVTFGAGGSTREGSFELVDKLKNQRGLSVVAYIAGIGLGPDDLTSILDKFKGIGVETILAVRGDAPQEDVQYTPHPDALPHASDLLAFIKSRYDFCLGAGGYPEGHIEAPSKEKDIEYLKLKVESGADYIVAQYFYDNRYFFDFMEKCRAAGINAPIVPGVMPIYNVKMMETLANICGVTITDTVRQGLSRLPPDDKGAVSDFGVELATQQCRELLENGAPGLHFYTMNRSKSVVAIVNTLRSEGRL